MALNFRETLHVEFEGSITAAARAMEIDQGDLSRISLGQRPPRRSERAKIEIALGRIPAKRWFGDSKQEK